MDRLVRPPEDRRRCPWPGAARLRARPVDGMDVREIDRMQSSLMPVQVQVSLIDRGLRFVETSFRNAAPQFLPPGPAGTTPEKRTRVRRQGGVNVESQIGAPALSHARSHHGNSEHAVREDRPRFPADLAPPPRRGRTAAARRVRTTLEGVPASGPSSGPSSDHASGRSSGHHRSTQTCANPQVGSHVGASVYWSDSLRCACMHAHHPLEYLSRIWGREVSPPRE